MATPGNHRISASLDIACDGSSAETQELPVRPLGRIIRPITLKTLPALGLSG